MQDIDMSKLDPEVRPDEAPEGLKELLSALAEEGAEVKFGPLMTSDQLRQLLTALTGGGSEEVPSDAGHLFSPEDRPAVVLRILKVIHMLLDAALTLDEMPVEVLAGGLEMISKALAEIARELR